MDTNKKYIKNKLWKKKYKSRSDTASHSNTKTDEQSSKQSGKESDDDLKLCQPIPSKGWFPETDSSSSDLEDFELVLLKSSNLATSNSGQLCKKSEVCDKKWFDKELDKIQLGYKNSENKSICTSQTKDDNLAKNNSQYKINANDNTSNCEEDKELDFLLSLKEPVNPGPVILTKTIDDAISARKQKSISSDCNATTKQKSVKSIDLEKWLDSVLSD